MFGALEDALMNATGLKNLVNDDPDDEIKTPADDELEDIAVDPAPASPEKEDKPAVSVVSDSTLDPRLKDYLFDALRSDKELRTEVRNLLEDYPDRTEYVWIYKGQKGSIEGREFIGEEAAKAAVSPEVLEFVPISELFTRQLHYVNENGDVGEEVPRDECLAYIEATKDEVSDSQPDKDDSSSTEG